jgi:hypothetical protein
MCFLCERGVRIFNSTSARKSIEAGTLDDASWLQPDAHYWTKRKPMWIELPDNIRCYSDFE